jgi:hypothetical protein
MRENLGSRALDCLIEKGKPMSGNYVQVGSILFKQY